MVSAFYKIRILIKDPVLYNTPSRNRDMIEIIIHKSYDQLPDRRDVKMISTHITGIFFCLFFASVIWFTFYLFVS